MNRKKLLSAISEAAQCYIPREDLTMKQKEKLDNIQIKLCSCNRCKGKVVSKVLSGEEV